MGQVSNLPGSPRRVKNRCDVFGRRNRAGRLVRDVIPTVIVLLITILAFVACNALDIGLCGAL